MAPILPDKIWGMTDHPLIVDLLSLNLKSLARVAMPGASIRVFSNRGLCSKRFEKAFGTCAIDHARCMRVLTAARCMDHKLFDKFKQFIIVSWKLRGHKTINVLWSA